MIATDAPICRGTPPRHHLTVWLFCSKFRGQMSQETDCFSLRQSQVKVCAASTHLSVPGILQHRGDGRQRSLNRRTREKVPRTSRLSCGRQINWERRKNKITARCSPHSAVAQLLVFPGWNRCCQGFWILGRGGRAGKRYAISHTFCTHGLAPFAHTHLWLSCWILALPGAYDLLIMNLNPLFWVNELKEIGQGMKATGPINSILWCITLAHHSGRLLCAFCLYPLCYSLIILSRVRVRVDNCAERLSLRMAKDSPKRWHSPQLCPATLNYANYSNSLIFFLLPSSFSLLYDCILLFHLPVLSAQCTAQFLAHTHKYVIVFVCSSFSGGESRSCQVALQLFITLLLVVLSSF